MREHKVIVDIKNLDIGYGNKVIIQDINIAALKGQMICLLGPNGAGKTTMLRTISGHLKPLAGSVKINDKQVNEIPKKDLAKTLSVVLTEKINPGLFTSRELVELGRHPYTNFFGKISQEDEGIVDESLKMVTAEHLANRYFSTLSDGEKQKIMIARALCQRPEVMILDEPTSHLDVKNRIDVLSILREMTREMNITAIISLHDVDLALKTCDIVVLIGDGKIIDWGSPEHVIRPDTINKLYSIKNAGYSHKLGCLELLNDSEVNTFIIGGDGSAISTFRLLSRMKIGFNAGILNENDADAMIAQTMGVDYIKNDEYAIDNAKRIVDKCELVICTNENGQTNKKLIKYCQDKGMEIEFIGANPNVNDSIIRIDELQLFLMEKFT